MRHLLRSLLIPLVLWLAPLTHAEDGEGSVLPDPTPLPANPVPLRSLSIANLRGVLTNLAALAAPKATVVVFLYPDCPLSRQAVPVLNQIQDDLQRRGGTVLGVFHAKVTPSDIQGFALGFATKFTLIRDISGSLAAELKATTTPEAFVLDAEGRIRYAGRVDDRYRVRGVRRHAAEREDLQEAVRDVLAGVEVRIPRTRAVGCALERKPLPVESNASTNRVTYHREVVRILNTHCVRCHVDGGIAPFSLANYDDVTDWMKTALREIQARRMPPAQAESDFPLAGQNQLSGSEIEALQLWFKGGMPEGNPADSAQLPPVVAPKGWDESLGGPPDIVLEQTADSQIGPKGQDIYWNVIFPMNLSSNVQVRAIQFLPSNRRVVHHALLMYAPHSDLESALARYATEAHGKEPGDWVPGYSYTHGLGFVPSLKGEGANMKYQGLPAYIPGVGAVSVPSDHDLKIPAGSDIMIQAHYIRTGKPERERSRIGIWLNRNPVSSDKKVFFTMWSGPFLVIPKGSKNVVLRGSFTLVDDYRVAGLCPHGHQVATEITITARPPGAPAMVLARIPQWDFNWQAPVNFEDPVWLPKGTVIECTQVFDNTADNPRNPHSPPRDSYLGENSEDEMMFPGILLFGKGHPDPESQLLLRFASEMNRATAFRRLINHQPRYVADPDGTVRPNLNAAKD